MSGDSLTARVTGNAAVINRSFYDPLWSRSRLARPERFNTWPLVSALLPEAQSRLELGPGLRPRLPIIGTHFVDASAPVTERLNACGAAAQTGDAAALPFQDQKFDLVCAFDILEHVDDDERAFSELSRVLKEGGVLVFSVPLHDARWNAFDDFVGHVRRYEPAELMSILHAHDLVLEKSAVFGMQPASPRLLRYAIWFLIHRPFGALFCYNWLFLPLALIFQKRLKFSAGLIETRGVDEILLVCRRRTSGG
jgi:SAM-dependent methyltransferase